MNISLELVLAALSALVGFPALWAFVIDVLKHYGVVNDGTSGKWSAALNLVSFTLVAIALQFFPAFDLKALDVQLFDLVKLAAYAFGLVVQLGGTKAIHTSASKPLVAKLFGGSIA